MDNVNKSDRCFCKNVYLTLQSHIHYNIIYSIGKISSNNLDRINWCCLFEENHLRVETVGCAKK